MGDSGLEQVQGGGVAQSVGRDAADSLADGVSTSALRIN